MNIFVNNNRKHMEKTIHHGRNVKRFREMLGIKQEAMAFELGEEWSQRKISLLEQKEEIDDKLLAEISRVLKIPVDAFKNFDEETAVLNIQNNYEGSNTTSSPVTNTTTNYNCTFNPLDKIMEQMEEIKNLYAALLKEKDEKIALTERLASKK